MRKLDGLTPRDRGYGRAHRFIVCQTAPWAEHPDHLIPAESTCMAGWRQSARTVADGSGALITVRVRRGDCLVSGFAGYLRKDVPLEGFDESVGFAATGPIRPDDEPADTDPLVCLDDVERDVTRSGDGDLE